MRRFGVFIDRFDDFAIEVQIIDGRERFQLGVDLVIVSGRRTRARAWSRGAVFPTTASSASAPSSSAAAPFGRIAVGGAMAARIVFQEWIGVVQFFDVRIDGCQMNIVRIEINQFVAREVVTCFAAPIAIVAFPAATASSSAPASATTSRSPFFRCRSAVLWITSCRFAFG